MTIYSFSDRPLPVMTPACGSKWKPQKEDFVDDDGVRNVRVCGKFNLFEYVQSFRLATDLKHLIDRYTNGEYQVLNSRPATFADVAGMPENIHAAYKTFQQAKDLWSSLDPDVRSFYGNDLGIFLSRYEQDLAAKSQSDVKEESSDEA